MEVLRVLIIILLHQSLNTFSNASRRDIIKSITSVSTNQSETTPDKINETTNKEVVSSITKKNISSHSLKSVKFGSNRFKIPFKTFCYKEVFRPGSQHQVILHMVKELFACKCEEVRINYESELSSNALSTGIFDIYIEPLYIGFSLASNYSILYPHDTDDLCFLVPEVPPMEVSLLMTVPSSVWLTTAASILAFLAAAAVGYGLHLPVAAFEVVSTLITGAFDDRLRRLMIWLCLLSFFLWNFIGGNLTGSFVNPGHGRVLDSLEKIDAAISRIIRGKSSGLEYIKFLETSDNDVDASLVRKFVVQGSELLLKEDEALLVPQYGIDFFRIFVYKRWHQKLVPADVCMFSPCYVSFPVRNDWEHAQRFNELLQRTIETGLYDIVKKEYCRKYGPSARLSGYCNPLPKPDEEVKPLELKFLKESFVMFGFGISCAVVSFVAENVHRIRRLGWHVCHAIAVLALIFRKMCINLGVSICVIFRTLKEICTGQRFLTFSRPRLP